MLTEEQISLTNVSLFCFPVLVGCFDSNEIYSTADLVREPVLFTLLRSFAKRPHGMAHDELGRLYITERDTRIVRINSKGSDEVNLVPNLGG